MSKAWLCIAIQLLVASVVHPSPFINLDFEMANTNNIFSLSSPTDPSLPSYPSGQGTIADLTPGWDVRIADFQAVAFSLNVRAIGAGAATLVSRDAYGAFSDFFDSSESKFEGKYAMALTLDQRRPLTLSQTGDVPSDAQFITYNANLVHAGLEIRMNDILIENRDISAFAGQTVDLEFTFYWGNDLGGPVASFDSVAFVIPEPGSVALLAMGAVGIAFAHRRSRERKQ